VTLNISKQLKQKQNNPKKTLKKIFQNALTSQAMNTIEVMMMRNIERKQVRE
jgi:hypothetical protein